MNSLPEIFFTAYATGKKLRERLGQLQYSQFTNKDPKNLCEYFIKVTDIFLESITSEENLFWKKIEDRKDILRKVRMIVESFKILHSFLRYIEACLPERIPYQMLNALRLFISETIPDSEKDCILIRPKWKYNFEYFDLLSEMSKTFPPIYDDVRRIFERIPVISFPGIDKENILALVSIAHEIGHYIDYRGGSPLFEHQGVEISFEKEMIDLWIQKASEIYPDIKELPALFRDNILNNIFRAKLEKMVSIWLREFTADIIAARLFGPAYLLSIAEIFKLLPSPKEIYYPSNQRRLEEISKELNEDDGKLNWAKFFETNIVDIPEGKVYFEYIKDIESKKFLYPIDAKKREVEIYLYKLEENILEKATSKPLKIIKNYIRETIAPDTNCFRPTNAIPDIIELLKYNIPPNVELKTCFTVPRIYKLREILNASCLYWLHKMKEDTTLPHDIKEWEDFNKITFRALELSHIHQSFIGEIQLNATINKQRDITSVGGSENVENDKGVMTADEIIKFMKKDFPNCLVITPIIDPNQIQGISVDLRLGNKLITMKRSTLHSIDIKNWEQRKEEMKQIILRSREEVYLNLGEKFVLHPGEFVLGHTLEYLYLHPSVMGYILGRSTWGRLGLIIATATKVDPGYKGTPTLEISNLGTVPIELTPGILICQIVFHRTDKETKPYEGPYKHTTEASGPL